MFLVWLVAHHTQPNTQHPHALHYQNTKLQMGFPKQYVCDRPLVACLQCQGGIVVFSQDWLPQHNGRLHFLSVGLALASEHARNGLVVLLVILRPIRTLVPIGLAVQILSPNETQIKHAAHDAISDQWIQNRVLETLRDPHDEDAHRHDVHDAKDEAEYPKAHYHLAVPLPYTRKAADGKQQPEHQGCQRSEAVVVIEDGRINKCDQVANAQERAQREHPTAQSSNFGVTDSGNGD